MDTLIIRGSNIVKNYGQGNEKTKVLDNVSIEIKRGDFVAVMGPSGCGKTTLLFALSGMDSISSGSVKFDDTELSEMSENQLADLRRTRMGFVFQQPTMLKNLNILDNIILPGMQEAKKDAARITKKARDLMSKTGIVQLADRDITEVSGGQLQRAGICRALMSEPDILFADEPTGALNSTSAQEIMELFSGINQDGTAVFLVTHDINVAARADKVLFMKDGKIKSELRLDKFSVSEANDRAEQVGYHMKKIGI